MSSHAHLLPRYQHFRQVAQPLASALVRSLGKAVMDEGGQALGLLKRGVLVFNSDREMAVLMDYCIQDVLRDGRNGVERFLAESPPPPDSDEMLLLQALRDARFGIYLVEEVERGVGVQVRDSGRGDTFFLFDVGLGKSVEPGLVMLARIIRPENIPMTTGATLPMGQVSKDKWPGWIRDTAEMWMGFEKDGPSREKERLRNTALIAGCIELGLSEPSSSPGAARAPRLGARPLIAPPERPVSPVVGGMERVGRNDPCPCKSGKKFKNCCARNR